jgi:DNA replication protein DnaC
MPLAEFARRMMAMAIKATGMSESQIREAAEKMGDALPERPRTRDSRQVVADRGVPEKHIKSIYDREPIECDALRAVRDFLDSDKTSLVLAGGTGTRKSGSACWALTHRPGVFVTEDEVMRLYTSRLPDDIEAWRRIRQAQVLVVDDIGEYSDDKGWGVKVITGLWNHRYSSELKLIVTANKTPAEFKAEFGERIVDRVRESGRFVELGGQSVRRSA